MKKRGFVVSAILYPLLVLFLALIMGMLSMTDTRKRILDRMKLEIEDSIFDDETCSCDTILNKLNYLIKNGVGGGGASGSYTFNMLTLRVKGYPSVSAFPNRDNAIGDIAVITEVEIPDYFISQTPPNEPKEGSIWIVQDIDSPYFVESDYSRIGINYAMQYVYGEWCIVKTYVFMDNQWTLLYYVPVDGTHVNLSGTDINAETLWKFNYSGSYQTFHARFSGTYEVQLWGASGATNRGAGGLGSYTKGVVYLNAGDILYVYVGGTASGTAGGWNGGGNGSGAGRGGGGATDLRLVSNLKDTSKTEFESLKSRIMVAAGGGGGNNRYVDGSNYSYNTGGAGGAYDGYVAYQSARSNYDYRINYGTGATQSSPGYYSRSNGTADGSFGYGGGISEAGGGGGYYGGGGGAGYGGGGGGSSYISGHIGCSSIDSDSTPTNITHTGSAFHESGYYFKETKMVDGQGYLWSPDKSPAAGNMPTQDGSSTMSGNSGNGYAKIKLVTVEVQTLNDRQKDIESKNIDFYYSYAGRDSVHGTYQPFTVPKTGTYKVELWGAQGSEWTRGYVGGLGGYTGGNIYLKKGEKLYVYVGAHSAAQLTGGFNGGGDGNNDGRGGGGATDIRLTATSVLGNDFESLKTRIMVAAGGGGAAGRYVDGSNYSYSHGGAGGGLEGYLGNQAARSNYNYAGNFGSAGTQVIGGYCLAATTSYLGDFGIGGSSTGSGSGGGGGFYGGGGGAGYGTGGGGSSYISGHTGCSSIERTSTEDAVIQNGGAVHYSGRYFTNTKMIDGAGYEWDSSKIATAQVNQPTYGGNNLQTGNSKNGKARIHLISTDTKTDSEILSTQKNIQTDWYYPHIAVSGITSNSKYQKFNVPKNGYYQIEMCGGSGVANRGGGGAGGCTSGKIYLFEGNEFYIYVGGAGYGTSGGWNGGGNGSGAGRGGGGATDIRLVNFSDDITQSKDFESLKSRIMVAAGGGGGNNRYVDGSNYSYGTGGAGGGLEGANGAQTARANYNYYQNFGSGATQSRPGYYSNSNETADGAFGYGGSSEAGGGGGYYGGGGGAGYGAGGGGSSYISGHTGCSSIEQHSTKTAVLHNGSVYHYSGNYFINTTMSSGTNTGNGYAKIKYLSSESKTKNELDTYRINHNLNFRFSYAGSNTTNGTYQTFEVPKTGNYYMELWGAQGGNFNPSYLGGLGGYTKGKIYLVKGTKLYVYVGAYSNQHITPSWNGGGTATGNGRAGGGATDIRTRATSTYSVWEDFDSLKSRIMVAGGGGGADGRYVDSSNYSYSQGGAGGGLTGNNGAQVARANYNYGSLYGTGGTQVSGGQYSSNASLKGSFGKGDSQYAGGGSGWFGGGSSAAYGAGGGGSSYISGHRGCVGVDSSGNLNSSAYTTYNDSVSWTNYAFTETIMVDGTGYRWDTAKITNEVFNMPTHDGSTRMTGNTGDGHAKITYIGA